MRKVLMLEDDPDDRFITQSMLEELDHDVVIQFVQSSTELLSALVDIEKPHLIIIDYNSLPQDAGQVLKQLKGDEKYKAIPIVVLGETQSPKYISEYYGNGASTYIKKPDSLEGTRHNINTFFKYWLSVATL